MFQGEVLVTGATGDTGRAAIDELLARGHQVLALANAHDNRSKQTRLGRLRRPPRLRPGAFRVEGYTAGLLHLPHPHGDFGRTT